MLQLHNCPSPSPCSFPRDTKQRQPRADVSYRWISIRSQCCRNSFGPLTGHLKARAGSPRWDTVCCSGPFTLILAWRLPTTARGKGRGRRRGRKYSGRTGFLRIEKTELHLVVRDLVLAVMWNLIKKEEKAQRQSAGVPAELIHQSTKDEGGKCRGEREGRFTW